MGKRFGRLVVQNLHSTKGRASWVCKCDCGKVKVVDAYHLRCKETRSCGCSKPGKRKAKGHAGKNQLWLRYKHTAKTQYGLPFELDPDVFEQLTSSCCFYCGVPPRQIYTNNGCKSEEAREHAAYKYNGIDRVDNSKGYTDDNVVSCCKLCNKWKGAMTQREFFAHVENIFRRRS